MYDLPLAQPFTAKTTIKLNGMNNGEYKCYASYRFNEADEWKACEGNEEAYLELLINDIMLDVITTKPFTLELVSEHPTSFEAGEDIQFTATAKVTQGTLHESLTIVCTTRDNSETSIILPIAMMSCYYSEGETFDIPIQIPGQLPEGKYCISAISSNRVIINELLDFDITPSSGIDTVNVDDKNQSLSQSERASIYNIAGQRLNAPTKGVNIINGKAVVIK